MLHSVIALGKNENLNISLCPFRPSGLQTVPWGTPDVVTPVADEAPADWYAVLETIRTV